MIDIYVSGTRDGILKWRVLFKGINQRLPIIFKLENVDYLIGPNEKRVVFDVMLTFKPERLACMMGEFLWSVVKLNFGISRKGMRII